MRVGASTDAAKWFTLLINPVRHYVTSLPIKTPLNILRYFLSRKTDTTLQWLVPQNCVKYLDENKQETPASLQGVCQSVD